MAANDRLFPSLSDPVPETPALRFPDRTLDYPALRAAAAHVAHDIASARRIAVWAEPRPETCVAIVGARLAGIAAVPINPKWGERELGHILADSAPDLVAAPTSAALPPALEDLPRIPVDLDTPGPGDLPAEPPPETPALVVYTSGTTGPPKGAVLPRRPIASNLDALADAWAWTASDVVTHALPLFHVHGLVLGVLGPLRRGGTVRHLVRFSPEAVAAALGEDATVLFGVPTMYRRLADAARR